MNRDEFYIALERNRAYVEEHSNELKHWGILGMKWGVRRYQNPDGTLTDEGKRRYGRIGHDMSVAEARETPYVEGDDAAKLLRTAIDRDNCSFSSMWGDKKMISVLAKRSYDDLISGKLNKEILECANDAYEEYKSWYDNYYEEERPPLTESQFKEKILPNMRKQAIIANDGDMTIYLDHEEWDEPLGGHAIEIDSSIDDEGHRSYKFFGID